MAARRRRRSTSRSGRSAGPGLLSRAAMLGLMLGLGLLGGYFWRSYYPVVLPFESKLVADRTSSEIVGGGDPAEVRELLRRAEEAEAEVASMRDRMERIEAERARAERELADHKIKSVLQGAME